MRVKKFQGENMPEVMKKVKSELGPDAVLLNSKTIKTKGFLGLFQKEQMEVVAAVDPEEKAEKTAYRKDTAPPSYPQEKNAQEPVIEELRELKAMIQRYDVTQEKQLYPSDYQSVYEHLIDKEVEENIAAMVVDAVLEKYEVPSTPSDIGHLAARELTELLNNVSVGAPSFSKPFIHLFGPTGVGKTTTLAKLAADAVLNRGLKVGFITTDTYRIAAIDQLKTYAGILDIPLEVAYNLKDYKEAKEKYKDYDLVFVDTAGRNFRNPAYIKELQEVMEFDHEAENYLVLSLTSKYRDMKEIFKRFTDIPLHQIIFSKADETVSAGSAVNLTVNEQVGIAYFTNGQNVPDDIKKASPKELAGQVMEGFMDERPS
ncbi:flagellar biosynthesis protein FlhF [Halobacillus litoralis]|uniref:flagellar biosynthesis protein FlhF n=1 Tax=Halobacillus litoralis TaxID=45668 RepID=UPI001CFDCCD1|nr:flagellar biosynthesis protein FlhF [Halobacillus litoralis]